MDYIALYIRQTIAQKDERARTDLFRQSFTEEANSKLCLEGKKKWNLSDVGMTFQMKGVTWSESINGLRKLVLVYWKGSW